jgi:hypothetical protein
MYESRKAETIGMEAFHLLINCSFSFYNFVDVFMNFVGALILHNYLRYLLSTKRLEIVLSL